MELQIRPSPALADVHNGKGLKTEERAAILRAVWAALADADVHIFGAVAGDEISFTVRVFGTVRTLSFVGRMNDSFPIADWSDVTARDLMEIRSPVGKVELDGISPPLLPGGYSK